MKLAAWTRAPDSCSGRCFSPGGTSWKGGQVKPEDVGSWAEAGAVLAPAVASLASGRKVLIRRSRLIPPGTPPLGDGCQLSSGSLSCSSFFSPASSASYFLLTALQRLLGAGHSGEVGGKKAGEES